MQRRRPDSETGRRASGLRGNHRQHDSSVQLSPSTGTSQSTLPNQNALMRFDMHALSDAFLFLKEKFVKLLSNCDVKNRTSQEVVRNLELAELGGKTLREIGSAIIERDPHYACINKIFEELWILGFTKIIKVSVKLETEAESAEISSTVLSLRKSFLNNWIGALFKLQDVLLLYKDPQSAMQILPSLENFLPPGYNSSNETNRQKYQLPINYLLRDIALCLARAHSYEDKELEKVWMERASQLNFEISGRRYKDAWQLLTQSDGRVTGREDPISTASEEPQTGPVNLAQRTFAEAVAFPNIDKAIPIDFQERDVGSSPLLAGQDSDSIPSSPVDGRVSSSASTKSSGHEYGKVTANLNDLAILKTFMSRNSFLEGLLQGAESQGLIELKSESQNMTKNSEKNVSAPTNS